jgi:hypothetical protein
LNKQFEIHSQKLALERNDMESKTKNKKSREQIESMAVRAFSGIKLAAGEEAVTELKQGWFNAAYEVKLEDGREVILKIAPPQSAEVMIYEKNIMVTEVASMRLVRQNPAIPGPRYIVSTMPMTCATRITSSWRRSAGIILSK